MTRPLEHCGMTHRIGKPGLRHEGLAKLTHSSFVPTQKSLGNAVLMEAAYALGALDLGFRIALVTLVALFSVHRVAGGGVIGGKL